jgi:tetratricopeptide (TPR) repeat protein
MTISAISQRTEAEQMKKVFVKVIAAEAKQIPRSPTREQISRFAPTIPHIGETATTWLNWLADDDIIHSFLGLGYFYEGQANYIQAEPWLIAGSDIVQARLGRQHPDVATLLNTLAELYRIQGRYREAQHHYVQALSIRETQLGATPGLPHQN